MHEAFAVADHKETAHILKYSYALSISYQVAWQLCEWTCWNFAGDLTWSTLQSASCIAWQSLVPLESTRGTPGCFGYKAPVRSLVKCGWMECGETWDGQAAILAVLPLHVFQKWLLQGTVFCIINGEGLTIIPLNRPAHLCYALSQGAGEGQHNWLEAESNWISSWGQKLLQRFGILMRLCMYSF